MYIVAPQTSDWITSLFQTPVHVITHNITSLIPGSFVAAGVLNSLRAIVCGIYSTCRPHSTPITSLIQRSFVVVGVLNWPHEKDLFLPLMHSDLIQYY